MKAMTATRYGGPETMQLEEVPTPTIGDDDVLVAVRATSLQALDWHLLRADPAIVRLGEGFLRPKRTIHGVDVAGVVETVGAGVDDLRPGDEVFGWSDRRYAMAGVNADGRILGPMLPFLRLLVRGRFDRRARVVRADENADDLGALVELVEAGALRPVIDRCFPLAEAADAMRVVEQGRAAGKVVVTI